MPIFHVYGILESKKQITILLNRHSLVFLTGPSLPDGYQYMDMPYLPGVNIHAVLQGFGFRACRRFVHLSGNSHIATLVERQTRYVMLVKIAGKDTETVINALIKQAKKLPAELYQSLTWDWDKEMADHKRFTLATDVQVYFCDPQSSWQRGPNENANGLLRQYLPKGTDLSAYTQAQLNAVARRLNERLNERAAEYLRK
jgi:hypothetical protein